MRSWRRVLTEVERALEQPAGALPRRLLIQTRVVLEAERDRASDPPPDDIAERVRQAFVRVARRLQNPSDARDEGAAPGQLTLSWPVSPIILTSGFGHRPDPIHRDGRIGFHAGVDLAGHRGDEIYAAAKGEVIFAGRKGGLGRAIFVQHAGGFVTVYAHLSRALVVPGTLVDRQTCVGLMGSTGRATGAHLHFEIRFGGVPLDPLEHLRLGASTAAR
jgi:murein DD-endopeptidase MepM/ murein hydrolase activator NlpD